MSTSGGNQASSPVPVGVTSLAQSSGQQANAVATATLGGQAGKTTYITGFDVTSSGATAGSVVDVTVTGLNGTTLHYAYVVQAGVGLQDQTLAIAFTTPLAALAPNTAIVVSCPALGAGNTNCVVNAYGFRA